jgi:hypothetical protein
MKYGTMKFFGEVYISFLYFYFILFYIKKNIKIYEYKKKFFIKYFLMVDYWRERRNIRRNFFR